MQFYLDVLAAQTFVLRPFSDLGAGGETQLVEDVGDVGFDGALGDDEGLSDFTIRA